jgi:acetyl-CoA synthetase
MLADTTDTAKLCRDLRWDIPERFNLATACCAGLGEADSDFILTLDQGPEDGQPQ